MARLLVSATVLCIPVWIVWRFKFFRPKRALQNVAGPPSTSFLTGVLKAYFDGDAWNFHKDMLEEYGSIVKISGILGDIALDVSDPKALQHIFVKDQHLYGEPEQFTIVTRLLFGPGLLGSLGVAHRNQRKILNPVFSMAHMREMSPTFYSITHKLVDAFTKRVLNGPHEIDAYSWCSRTVLELISQSGLGYSFDPLVDDGGQHPYALAAKRLIPTLAETTVAQIVFAPLMKMGSPRFRRFVLNMMPWKALHDIRDIVDIMWDTSVSIYEPKKQTLLRGDELIKDQVQEGKDIISSLMKANISASEEDKLTEDEIIGQMGTLIFTAMDTTASAMARVLWLLSGHQDIQQKLRHELSNAIKEGNGDIGYDDLVSLPYLDAVCRESLRLYPPIPIDKRVAQQDVVLPISKPITGVDGKIWGPDSYEFNPERWLNPLPDSLTSARIPGIFSNMMTFAAGGRACIGFKFSQLEMKVLLSGLIQNFKISLPDDKEIIWKMNTIACPVVVGESDPRLPLIVRFSK